MLQKFLELADDSSTEHTGFIAACERFSTQIIFFFPLTFFPRFSFHLLSRESNANRGIFDRPDVRRRGPRPAATLFTCSSSGRK